MRKLIVIAATAAMIAILAIYYVANPLEYELFPKCIIYSSTGMQCPSCGSQRALHAFLHGRFGEAVRYNVFALYSVPYFIAVLTFYFGRFKSARLNRIGDVVVGRTAAQGYVGLYFAWWVVRNVIGM